WFTLDDSNPQLLGLRDPESNTYFFPKDVSVSRAPGHSQAELEEVALSRTGKLWSYTTNHYKPPAPYVSADPFEPYTVAAVELGKERIVILGQLADEVDPTDLQVGQEMEVTLGTLYEDDENEYLVWKWKPVAA
ncbi:MAG: OB-fold domain-containing protein, partial [Myxococcota bacterium]